MKSDPRFVTAPIIAESILESKPWWYRWMTTSGWATKSYLTERIQTIRLLINHSIKDDEYNYDDNASTEG